MDCFTMVKPDVTISTSSITPPACSRATLSFPAELCTTAPQLVAPRTPLSSTATPCAPNDAVLRVVWTIRLPFPAVDGGCLIHNRWQTLNPRPKPENPK